ncbi:uncharacterized protein Z518_04728 [Rhinocladiella mackenziei CBS 650.93]|uniref:Uncharacterized protein n=1 Tax=Rhinocladiella mackenziei CBS 650.93 TaxID=1442369 RepID=A0A0D2FWU0_9EURO|nr:uncharacterized protein Z518_04728 [Rhinocladiella mackenziei CBS 650.93]KIX06752.1 hypothetical protein Z518_04728 [Rhinocladiella mackenziei CBS 650.93]
MGTGLFYNPEERLPPMIVGAAALPIGLFWTSDPHISWVPSVLATALIGGGCLVTFWNYIIDCYSNSAIAINTFIRFPLFAPAMYHNLGVAWATSLLAFLCVAFFPSHSILQVWREDQRKIEVHTNSHIRFSL